MSAGVVERFGTLIHDTLRKVEATQAPAIDRAAEWAADTIAADGIVYTFGTGHSHCVAEEVVYRAGGLAPVDAILEPSITGTTDVVTSEFMERIEEIATVALHHRRLQPRDLLIIVSNSGRNGTTVEAALTAKQMGLKTVAVTSLDYSRRTTSRHSSGKQLYEVADLVIDNCGVLGDAALHLEGLPQPVGPTSNIAALFIMHSITALAAQKLIERGVEPPVFWSGNLDGAREKNQALLDRYWGRIKVW